MPERTLLFSRQHPKINLLLPSWCATLNVELHVWVCPQGQMKEKSWWAGCRWKTSETVRWEWKLRMRLRGVERSDERKGHVREKKWNPDDQMQQEAVIFLWSVQHTEHGNIWRNCISFHGSKRTLADGGDAELFGLRWKTKQMVLNTTILGLACFRFFLFVLVMRLCSPHTWWGFWMFLEVIVYWP